MISAHSFPGQHSYSFLGEQNHAKPGRPLLRQSEKGLPKTIIVGVVARRPAIAGAPMHGGFVSRGRYEFEQVST
jgi:hypothetical protein